MVRTQAFLPLGPLELVPQPVALGLFLRALRPYRGAMSDARTLATYLSQAGFSPTEGRAIGALPSELERAEKRAAASKKPSAILAEMSGALERRLGGEAASKLERHLAYRVRPRVLIFQQPHAPTAAPKTARNDSISADLEPKFASTQLSTSAIRTAMMFACLNDSGSGIAPYCADTCGGTMRCSKTCRLDDETCTNCGDYGACDADSGGGGGGTPDPSVYVYQDDTYNGSTLFAYTSAQTDPGYDVQVEITIEDPYATASGYGYQSASATAAAGVSQSEMSASSSCPDCGNPILISIIIRIIAGGIVKKILSWFRRTTVGASTLCYAYQYTTADGVCTYQITPWCAAVCAAEVPYFHKSASGVCEALVQNNVAWARTGSSSPKCLVIGVSFANQACRCETLVK